MEHSISSSRLPDELSGSTSTATPRGTLSSAGHLVPLLPPPSAAASSKSPVSSLFGHQRPTPSQFPVPSRSASGSASAGALLETAETMSSQARNVFAGTANTSTHSLISKEDSEATSMYPGTFAERLDEWPMDSVDMSEMEHASKQQESLPDRPRGSYIYASGKVYWLNYDDPLDLQRLPAGAGGLACEQDSVTSAPSRDLASPAERRQVASHRERSEQLYGSGSRKRLHSGGGTSRCLRRYGAPVDAGSEDSSMDEDASPRPSPPEPLLPETPQPCTRMTAKTEPRVPRLWDNADASHGGAQPDAGHGGIQRRGHGSMARTLSTVWQQDGKHEATPRWERLSPVRSMVLIGSADYPSGASINAPMLNSTTPRSSRTQLVRRHLSAPRLHGTNTALTPRSISPNVQRVQRSYVPGPRVQQASTPSRVCTAIQAPLSARVRSVGPTATLLPANVSAVAAAATAVNTQRLTPRNAHGPTRRSAILPAPAATSPSPPLGLLACATPAAAPGTVLMQGASPRRQLHPTPGGGTFSEWPTGVPTMLQPFIHPAVLP